MSGDFGLPAVLTTSTLDELLLRLDRAFYPVPTAGFVARWWVLTAVTIAYILLLFLCLGLHAKYSTAGFRGLWLIRRVERPSGRFLVLNSRLAWTVPAVYGLYELVYLVIFYRVHTHHMSQRAWFAVRSLNAPLIFVVGWLASWSGLQGFLVAIERNDERFVPAWVANAIFVAGGAILFTVDIGMAIATSILGIRFWNRFEDLRDALIAIKSSVGDRVPTLVDFIPLQAPAQAFAEARKTWQSTSTVQYSFIALLPAACLLVNLGGLALARRLHTQIRDSIEVLAFVEARRTSTSRGIPLDNLSTPSKPRSSSPSTGGGMREQVDYIDLEHGPDREKEKEKRKQSLTTGEVKFLAKQRDEQGEPVETQAHARKVLSLQKAMRDLVMVAATIAVITLAFLIDSILVAIWSRTHAIYKGHWPVTEAAVALPGWIYSVPVFVSACYLIYNTVAIGRLTAPPVSTYASGTAGMFGKSRGGGGGGGGGAGATTTVPFPSAGSVVSHFVDQARSASSTDPTTGAEQSDELLSPALGERRRSSVVSVPKVTEQQTKRGSLGFPSWAGWKSGTRRTSGGTAGGKECRHGPGGGGGGGGERPNSLFSQGIVFTVETERVCEGDTCHLWDKEERRRKWLEGEREEGPFGEGAEEGRRSPLS